jgi:mannosyltransferase OCH1-like enzyme
MTRLQIFFFILFALVLALTRAYVMRSRLDQRDAYIPLKIWQTYKSTDLPKEAEKCQSSWKAQRYFEYHFMDDADMLGFMTTYFPRKVVQVFTDLPLGVMRADMWRYCVLFVHGGVYADIDAEALRPITDWHIRIQDRMIVGLENDLHFCQWAIVSTAQHPILRAVIDLIVRLCSEGVDTTQEHFVHAYTGPGVWTRAIHETLGFPVEQKARYTYQLSQMDAYKDRFERLGLRLEDRAYFSKHNVRNYFGSTQFSGGYVSWTEERDRLVKSSQNKGSL